MHVHVFSVLIISRLDSQSKFQKFTLFSGRHINVPRKYTNIAFLYWALHISAKQFDEYLKFGETHRPKMYLAILYRPISEVTSHHVTLRTGGQPCVCFDNMGTGTDTGGFLSRYFEGLKQEECRERYAAKLNYINGQDPNKIPRNE